MTVVIARQFTAPTGRLRRAAEFGRHPRMRRSQIGADPIQLTATWGTEACPRPSLVQGGFDPAVPPQKGPADVSDHIPRVRRALPTHHHSLPLSRAGAYPLLFVLARNRVTGPSRGARG